MKDSVPMDCPLLNRMERLGWLKGESEPRGGRRARKDYRLTADGRKVLAEVRAQLEVLYDEVIRDAGQKTLKK
jgi:DNA-binding PadR family transcriptional regulator